MGGLLFPFLLIWLFKGGGDLTRWNGRKPPPKAPPPPPTRARRAANGTMAARSADGASQVPGLGLGIRHASPSSCHCSSKSIASRVVGGGREEFQDRED